MQMAARVIDGIGLEPVLLSEEQRSTAGVRRRELI